MYQDTCAVEDCDRPANVPGSARGWCPMHYVRWRKHGDPLIVIAKVRNVCTIEGCVSFVLARGWCSKHHTRWRRYGDPTYRLPGEIIDGRRICPGCEQDKPVSDYSKPTGRCKPCAAATARQKRKVNPPPRRPTFPAICDECGTAFEGNARQWRFCSRECLRASWTARGNMTRRARVAGAWVEDFGRDEIFERDGYICQICDEPTDPDATWPDGRIPTIDHITPLSKGGEHSRANVQTAHLTCNLRKGVQLIA